MPSIFPFEATTATKISKGRTTRVSRGELGHEMASTSSSTKHFTSSVSKGSEGRGTEAEIMTCMFVNASSVKIRLSNWREKLLNQRERQQN